MNEGSDDVDDGLARTEKGKECLEAGFSDKVGSFFTTVDMI